MKQESSARERLAAVPGPVRAAFFSALIFGLALHLAAFTSLIPNSDGLSRMYDPQQMTVSGRWFLHYASVFHGFLQAPALIGGLSTLFLALSAALTADTLHLRRAACGVLTGGAFIAIPALAYTYLYLFTASAYAFAVLLAVAAVWMTRRWKWGWLPAALALACSLGTYQAYFAVAAALALMCAILDLLDPEKDLRTAVRAGLRSLGMLALAAAAYVGILWIFLKVKNLELLDYRGIGSVGEGSTFGAILRDLIGTYRQIAVYFLRPAFRNPILTLGNWATVLLTVLGGAVLLGRVRKEPARLILVLVGAALMPLACNFTRMISDLSPNMCYSFAMVYVFAAAILDRTEVSGNLLVRCGCAAAALVILGGAQVCSLIYTSSATAHRATEAFATNLVARVEQTPGYRSGMEVVVIGTFPRTVYHSDLEAFDAVEHYSCMSDTVLQLNKHVYYYLNDWLNVPWQEPDEDTMIAVSDSEAFRQMPLYPDDGSVRIEDGRVVVKLAPRYLPKQPYEIAYENRH